MASKRRNMFQKNKTQETTENVTLYPEPFNLAVGGVITSNATCGEDGPETWCRLRGHHQCGVCDSRSQDKGHPPQAAIDNRADTWWQSPTLHSGQQYNYVTLTLDLRQVYQVLHVRIRSGNSPRPGSWILERSVDGVDYSPWQYFATSGDECLARYNTKPYHGHFPLKSDKQVLCTTAYSKLTPVDGGEIHVSLTHGRPGWNSSSSEHFEFTKARYIRLRFQKVNQGTGKAALRHGPDITRRLYYTIKDILVQGRCICHGHASKCISTPTGERHCECEHNTCGPMCDKCCPLYNNEEWQEGPFNCAKCQCHGHAKACRYSSEIAAAAISLDASGNYSGGGECINCSEHTTGVNCEMCEDGWYRPLGVRPDAEVPCVACDCHTPGSTGTCTRDDSQGHLGKPAGSCTCREGYIGERCNKCAPGYRNYPNCRPCPCNPKGMLHGSHCQDSCQCKENVEGERCERCKSGYFFLDDDNVKGCTKCYCSEIATSCSQAQGYVLHEVTTMEGWEVCDLSTKILFKPYKRQVGNGKSVLSIAYYQIPSDVESFFWMAPEEYRGNLLTSYGSAVTFSVSWDVMRGDTSGKPTTGPDVVLIGQNGLRISYGDAAWSEVRNLSITVLLVEEGWYHMGEMETSISELDWRHDDDKVFRHKDRVTRGQLMSVLADVKHLLIRASFHMDQAEGSLESCVLEKAVKGGGRSTSTVGAAVENCTCPEGYAGLSCETCAFGYARITPQEGGTTTTVCTKCNCHGHAATCHPTTGQCSECQHNTTGVNCERCSDGYYGDATVGRVDDCRRCACPLVDKANNFSPTCSADHLGYICDSCPVGHGGRHCERCEPGYFGNPEEYGSKCRPCECGDGPCDSVTGRCLSCQGNTEGWRCDRCKPDHYGDPLTTGCLPCNCSSLGSVEGQKCDSVTGQCTCKFNFSGRSCDRCKPGLGNVSAGCVPCKCDSVGSVVGQFCDQVTGHCPCQPAVTGPACLKCLPKHYGYSHLGCKRCNCNTVGSLRPDCNATNGQCECRSGVIGRTCDTCQVGFWGLSSDGCKACGCDGLGTVNKGKDGCDRTTGQCPCKPGVGGLTCDTCLPNHYGMAEHGCSECEPCNKPGHICDPDTGRCVCPPHTTGLHCDSCLKNSWGYTPLKGCKMCDCDSIGSVGGGECHLMTGKCICRVGYTGDRCDSCALGHYGYPRCRPCGCSLEGTSPQHCHNGVCSCDNTGQCPCKENVGGLHCNICKEGTFGLRWDDPGGCAQCFCFGRSAVCREGPQLVWTRINLPRPRTLTVNYDNASARFDHSGASHHHHYGTDTFPVNTQEICYINLAMPGNGVVKNDAKKLNATNNLVVIPSDTGDIELGVNYLFYTPVYWQLPKQFLGDKVLSYGGFIRFTVDTEGESTRLPPAVLDSYPLVQIQGNGRMVLEYYPIIRSNSTLNHVRLHESLWRMKNNREGKVSRQTLMLALQNLQHVLIRATDSVNFKKAILKEVSIDSAVERGAGVSSARGIELCECPVGYAGSSCQDAAIGFYRYRPKVSSTIIIELVGEARSCQCNGRSNICNTETGHCIDCSSHTGGAYCERCADGHYGLPDSSAGCLACPCPSPHRNFAISCSVTNQTAVQHSVICKCRPGYTGKSCERCDRGWYSSDDGSCLKCRCHSGGSVNPSECHPKTGHCVCRPGVTGPYCSTCLAPRHVLFPNATQCTSCDDTCLNQLLDATDELAQRLDLGAGDLVRNGVAAPWRTLTNLELQLNSAQYLYSLHLNNTRLYEQLQNDLADHTNGKIKSVHNKLKKLTKKTETILESVQDLKRVAENNMEAITSTRKEIENVVARLKIYTEADAELELSTATMLHEAKQVLATIRDLDLELTHNRAVELHRNCKDLLNDLEYELSDKNEIEELQEKLENIMSRQADLVEILEKANSTVEMTKEKTTNIRKKSGTLNEKIQDIIMLDETGKDSLNASTYLNTLSDIYIRETQDNLEALVELRQSLQMGRKNIEKRNNMLDQLNKVYLEQYVKPAQQHADYLMNISKTFTNLLKADGGYAIKASKAYLDIVEPIEEARALAMAALETANIAYDKAYPGIGRDSLVDEAVGVKEVSVELERRATDQLTRGVALAEQLTNNAMAVDVLQSTVKNATADDMALKKQLVQLSTESVEKDAEAAISRCDDLIEESEEVQDYVAYLRHTLNDTLRNRLRQIEADGETTVNTAHHIISEAEATSSRTEDTARKLSATIDAGSRHFAAWNDTMAKRLQELRDKITQARHIADSIRLSMTSIGDSGGSCVRTYEPSHLEPSTMTSIVLTYAISSQLRDALLFYLPSSSTDDFVAIEMVNRKIRFVWDVGGGLGEVTHPLHIQTAGDLTNDQHWYRVEAQRMRNVGRLWVRPQVVSAGSALSVGPPAVNSSAASIGRLDVGPSSRVWVGGADRRLPHRLMSTQPGLVGCLHKVELNGRPIGLWNFRTQNPNSCTACIEGAEEATDDSSYSFSGDGYAVVSQDGASAYNKYLFSVSFNFKTFDHNALLFLALGKQKDSFISLSLSDGRVVFRIGYGGGESSLEMMTTGRYNAGNWTRVEASRYFDRKKKLEKGVLKVGDEIRDGAPTHPAGRDTIPDMSETRYFIGGLPPGVPPLQRNLHPFLGCMSELQIAQEGYNPLKGQFWGVQPSCSNNPLTVAGFYGNGYLELPSQTLKKKANFGFVFSTRRHDALLMLSTFEGLMGSYLEDKEEVTNLVEQEERKLSYYSVSLRRGQVDVRLNGGRGEVRLASVGPDLADAAAHSVSVSKLGRRLELRVDDHLEATALLPAEGGAPVRAPGPQGGLYFGGLPPHFNTTGRTFSAVPFVGTIKDAIFNDMILGFNDAVAFKEVTIGRYGPDGHEGDGLGETVNTSGGENGSGDGEGCRKVASYNLEPGAVKLGDTPGSHVRINLRKRSLLHKNFTLQLQFRTFHPNGLLFITVGGKGKQPHYLMVGLRNGRVHVALKAKRKADISAHVVVNDGIWHKMVLEKQGRHLVLRVDSTDPEKVKTAKRTNVGSLLYVGGLPTSGVNLPEALLNRLEGFKGCIRGLVLNNKEEDLVGDKAVAVGVGQCFPHIEPGSYFPGDAYAIYKNKFNIGSFLELELELRTSELNGVLLSVSEPDGYPALSLELEGGSVLLSGDMGDRRPFQVRQPFPTKAAACDNKWHRVQAAFFDDRLTLRVDGGTGHSYWLADNGHLTQATTNSPLYIGGIPEGSTSGTLQSRENFKGCLRNVIINGERRDWTDMAALQNILLSSCPLVSN